MTDETQEQEVKRQFDAGILSSLDDEPLNWERIKSLPCLLRNKRIYEKMRLLYDNDLSNTNQVKETAVLKQKLAVDTGKEQVIVKENKQISQVKSSNRDDYLKQEYERCVVLAGSKNPTDRCKAVIIAVKYKDTNGYKKPYKNILKKLAMDKSEKVRQQLVQCGYGLHIFIKDPCPGIRAAVARQGYGLKQLAKDKNPQVKKAVKAVKV